MPVDSSYGLGERVSVLERVPPCGGLAAWFAHFEPGHKSSCAAIALPVSTTPFFLRAEFAGGLMTDTQ